MKKSRFLVTASLAICMTFQSVGCTKSDKGNGDSKQEIKVFSSFIAAKGTRRNEKNEIQNLIAEKISAKCEETWVDENKDPADAVSEMIISGKYPDFIYGGTEQQKLIDANALIPLDEYLDGYDNLKNYFTEEEWDRLRADDGHVYMMPQFCKIYMYDTATEHDGEAFWLQVKVLQWAGYPELKTLDEYFDLIERYIEANPTDEKGNSNIGYEILTDGYLYFCLENPPQFLDGYPNDGCCIVDTEKLEARDFNTTPTAKKWFKKLNEEYHKGIIDQECFVLTADQYYEKIKTGNILGMVDQYWNFKNVEGALPDECKYVPFGIVIDESIEEHYHTSTTFDASQGMGISVDCEDIEGAMKFLNDLLSPEILTLRTWGIKDVDYCVDEDGMFYRTDEQTRLYNDKAYKDNHLCDYNYFPFYGGMNMDGKNAFSSENQPSEFYKKLSGIMKECFSAYGVQTFTEMLNKSEENPPWYPMWSYTNTFTPDTPYGKAKADMDMIKHEYLPKVVMSNDFESAWTEYMTAYNANVDVKAYFDQLTAYIRKCAGKE